MTRLLSTILLCCIVFTLRAQLPVDDKGKINFLEVVKDSTSSDSMTVWIKSWLQERYPNYTFSDSSKSMTAKGHFMVYVKEGVFQQVHGAIRYSLRLEVRENRYRYQFTDFIFEYYRQERSDLKYHPTGKEKPLEDKEFKGYQKLWDKHKRTTEQHVRKMIQSLKTYIALKKNPRSNDPKKAVPSGNDW